MREDIIECRVQKVHSLRESGVDPYPERSARTHTQSEVINAFESLCQENTQVTLVGRVRSMRSMGSIVFAHIEDESGKIQIFFKKDAIGEASFGILRQNVDIGDFIEASGTCFLSKQGEKTICAVSWRMLTKSIRVIPTEHFGIKDEEERLRRRYLDLLSDRSLREMFRKKAVFWGTVRSVLAREGFLEVQTPVLENIPGGADAEPFVTHHNALGRDFYLRISLELALKRLLVGGFERIFEIGRVFRNEGIDREHLQEFDHMEFYWAYASMQEGMALVETMFRMIVSHVCDSLNTQFQDETIGWEKPWPRIDYFDAFHKETGIDLSEDISVEVLRRKADELHIPFEKNAGKGRMIDTLYKKTVRKKLIQPCFLVGHPFEVSPLAKSDPHNPKKVLRFQPIAAASELGNGFAELNDPMDQRARFQEQMTLRDQGDKEAHMIDEDFLEALEYGMPPACGFGMSERFFAILMNRSIRETVFFPPMKDRPR